VAPERVARCDLVLEELFRNSVLHGHGGDSAHSIWLGVDHGVLWYEDEAPAFDPLMAALPDGGAVRELEEQRVGGVGLMLIRQLPSQVAYCYRDGRNRIVIVP
jgi:anti-sigma regulatory factor (Ser/Thr protein kinase)